MCHTVDFTRWILIIFNCKSVTKPGIDGLGYAKLRWAFTKVTEIFFRSSSIVGSGSKCAKYCFMS